MTETNTNEDNLNKENQVKINQDLEKETLVYKDILAKDPYNKDALKDLGKVYLRNNELLTALQYFKNLVQLDSQDPEGYFYLGYIYLFQEQYKHALTQLETAVKMHPSKSIYYFYLASTCAKLNLLDPAINYICQAIKLNPDYIDAYIALGDYLQKQSSYLEAIRAYQQGLNLDSENFTGYKHLGFALNAYQDFTDAMACFQEAQRISPDDQQVLWELVKLYNYFGYKEDVVTTLQLLNKYQPNSPVISNYLGLTLVEQGRIKEALDNYKIAFRLSPDNDVVHSNMLLATNYFPQSDPYQLMQAHQDWDQMHARDLKVENPLFFIQKKPEKKLRIGYLSPDFKKHSVSHFFQSLLEAHDRKNFETFCYSKVTKPDQITENLRQLSDCWRDIHDKTDLVAAETIRNDGIDILVDLAGHTGNNGLLIFARKPAPVQVTWLGYPNTTGLESMDYRITDSMADPRGKTDKMCSETLLRMPETFLCYYPPAEAPEINQNPPCMHNGYVTFGSFNNLAKINQEILEFWSRILKQIPNSKLVLKSRTLADPATKERFQSAFNKQGLSPERVELWDFIPSKSGHLGAYNQIDIALDPFPYNGTTTTCEALYMGVPVITLLGDRHSSRVSASILQSINHPELFGETKKQYLQTCRDLSKTPEKLREIRSSLRSEILNSPLCDKQRFAGDMEDLYRSIWKGYCQSKN